MKFWRLLQNLGEINFKYVWTSLASWKLERTPNMALNYPPSNLLTAIWYNLDTNLCRVLARLFCPLLREVEFVASLQCSVTNNPFIQVLKCSSSLNLHIIHLLRTCPKSRQNVNLFVFKCDWFTQSLHQLLRWCIFTNVTFYKKMLCTILCVW